jgi:hypothetical protein
MAKQGPRISSSWCLLRDNSGLREVMKFRMKKIGIGVPTLCKRTSEITKFNLEIMNVRNYLNHGDHKVTQSDLVVMCRVLGIKVSLKIETLDE